MPQETVRIADLPFMGRQFVHPYIDPDWRLTEQQIMANAIEHAAGRRSLFYSHRNCTTPWGARWCACGYYALEWPA